MIERFTISYYNNAGIRFFDTQCKNTVEELTYAGTLFYQPTILHMWTLETFRRFSLPKVIDIDQYLFNLFENVVGSVF